MFRSSRRFLSQTVNDGIGQEGASADAKNEDGDQQGGNSLLLISNLGHLSTNIFLNVFRNVFLKEYLRSKHHDQVAQVTVGDAEIKDEQKVLLF